MVSYFYSLIYFLHLSRVNNFVELLCVTTTFVFLCFSGLDSLPHGMEESEMQGMGGDQVTGIDSNSKLSEFSNRPGKFLNVSSFMMDC